MDIKPKRHCLFSARAPVATSMLFLEPWKLENNVDFLPNYVENHKNNYNDAGF